MAVYLAYYSILGKPLIFWLGILTFISLLVTALIGFLNRRGYKNVNLKYHFIFAKITLILATMHALLGILIYI